MLSSAPACAKTTRAPKNTLTTVETLPSVDFVRVGLVCVVAFGMAGCVGVTGKPGANPASPTSASLEVTPLSINFGSVEEGTSGQKAVEILNTGTESAKITNVALKGSGFSVQGMGVPLTILGGGSTSFKVEFAPGTAGAANGSIVLTTDGNNPPVIIALSGNGTETETKASITASPSSENFGDVVVGSDATVHVQLKVAGPAPIKISEVSTTGTGFSISGLTVPSTIKAGETASFAVIFKPATDQSESGHISIATSEAATPLRIDLSGKGVSATAGLSITPPNLSFGTVAVGKSTSKQLTVKSTGNSGVKISSIAVSGAGFSVSGVEPNTELPPGQTLLLAVKFDPSKSGNANGTVAVASNASNVATKISLSGAGSTTQTNITVQHVVTLRWDQSATTGVVGYYVYRGTQEGSYTKISSSVAGTSYADSNIEPGQNVYYYVVTAVDSSGTESAFSSQVSVSIPNP